jgi:hypothetical protein
MSKTVLIRYDYLGVNLGPAFDVVPDVGVASPDIVTISELLAGIYITIDDTTTTITFTSTEGCTNSDIVSITTTTTTTTL